MAQSHKARLVVAPTRAPVTYATLLAREDFLDPARAKRDPDAWRNSQAYRNAWAQECADLAQL